MEQNELRILITSQYDSLRAGFSEANSIVTSAVDHMKAQFQSLNSGMSSAVSSIASSLGSLGPMIAGALSIAGFKIATDAALDYASTIRGLTETMGMTAEKASVLNTALTMIGKTSEEYTSVNFKLARQIKSSEESLNKLGLVTRDANHDLLAQTDIFSNAVKVMMQYKEGTDRNQFALYAFGRGAKEVVEYQHLTNEVMERATEITKAWGLEVGERAVEQTRKLGMELNILKVFFEALKVRIGNELLPVLASMATEFGRIGGPIIDGLVIGVKVLVDTFDLLKTAVLQASVIIVGAFAAIYDAASIPIKAVALALTGDFAGAWAAINKGVVGVVEDIKVGLQAAGAEGEAYQKWTQKLWEKPPTEKTEPKGGKAFEAPEKKEGPTRLPEWKAELEAQIEVERGANQQSLDLQEIFWRDKWALTAMGSKEEREVEHQQFEVRKKQEIEYYDFVKSNLEADMARTKATWAEKIADQDKLIAETMGIYGEGSKQVDAEEKKKSKMIEEAAKAELSIREKYWTMETESLYTSETRKVEIAKLKLEEVKTLYAIDSKERVDALIGVQKATENAAKAGLKDELDALKLRKEDAINIKEKIALTDQMLSTILKSGGLEIEQYRALTRERAKLVEEQIKQEIEAKVKVLETDIRVSNEGARAAEENIKKRAELGLISAAQEIASLKTLEDQRYAFEQGNLEKIKMLWSDYEAKVVEVLDKIKLATQGNADAVLKINDEEMKKSVKNIEQWTGPMVHGMGSALSTMFKDVATGSKKMAADLKNVWNSIVMDFVNLCVKLGEEWAMTQLKQLLLTQTTESAKSAVTTVSAMEREAAEEQAAAAGAGPGLVAAAAGAMGDAVKAATGTWAALAGIPVIGPIIAPPAAAVAFAAVMAFRSMIPSAAGGYDVDRDQLLFAHKREMVLPANIAEGLRSMIGDGGGGGGGNFNFAPKIYALDSKGVDRVLKTHGEKFFKNWERGIRGRNLPGTGR